LAEFLASLAAEPYEHRGIPHSEMALIIGTCRMHDIKVVIESGRARGQSTYMLAKYLPDAIIHSFELRNHPDELFAQERLKDFGNVNLYGGNGSEMVPLLAAEMICPTAVLCDGPKGAAAVDIIAKCFSNPWVRVGFAHDMRRLDHGGPSPHRAYAVERFPNVMFSDDIMESRMDPWIDAGLDANVAAANGPVGPDHVKEFGSYGPTVGVFVNPSPLIKQS